MPVLFVKAGRRRPRRNSIGEIQLANCMQFLDGLARHKRDVATGDAQIVEFTVRQAAQLTHGFAVAAPVAVVADQVHFRARSCFSSCFDFFFSVDDAKIGAFAPALKRLCCMAAMRVVHCSINGR